MVFFLPKYLGRLVGHTSYVRGLLWHTELPHILSGPKRVAHRVCVERAKKNGDSHPGSQSTMMSRWIRSNFIKKLCYTSLYHRLDEEIIHQFIGKLSL